jgi:hypothetical protein
MKVRVLVVVTLMGGSIVVLACPPGPSLAHPCAHVVVEDTSSFFASSDTIRMVKQSDTVPKPFKTCVTLYALAKDTVPKP